MTATSNRPTSPFVREPDYDAPFIDRMMATASAEVAGNVVKHPLTEDQVGVLTCVIRDGSSQNLRWHNTSTTERVLAALAKKGLLTVASTSDRYGRSHPVYKPLPAMREAYLAEQAAREQARQEERAREQAEVEAKRAAAKEALQTDQSVLFTVLLAAKDRGEITDAQYTSAYNRVGALTTGWFS